MLNPQHPTNAAEDATEDTPTPAAKSRQRSITARIAAHVSWSRTVDRTARTAPAVRATIARFEKLVDPDGVMSPADRAKAAENAKRAYYSRLARRSHAPSSRRHRKGTSAA